MNAKDCVWQGLLGYWQNLFIHQNLLLLGYKAWHSYTSQGRGLLVCRVAIAHPHTVDWSVETVPFSMQFVALAAVPGFLRSLAAEVQSDSLDEVAIARLMEAIAQHDPTQSIVLLIENNGTVDINLLQHLAISPADCHRQVEHRQEEFAPHLTAFHPMD
ncbi:MAG: hypothetical protein Fur0046_15540 [Cyanobacteria bacterium J069]|nr:MAG: hypothetical protein D6742_02600 [Cyanobacteria bacterium J069]